MAETGRTIGIEWDFTTGSGYNWKMLQISPLVICQLVTLKITMYFLSRSSCKNHLKTAHFPMLNNQMVSSTSDTTDIVHHKIKAKCGTFFRGHYLQNVSCLRLATYKSKARERSCTGHTMKSSVRHLDALWLFNIAMENGPFIDGLPIKNGDFSWLC